MGAAIRQLCSSKLLLLLSWLVGCMIVEGAYFAAAWLSITRQWYTTFF